ncbi:hypothetical protein ACGF5M_00830 [Gemmatimonadota bacterium]
MGRRKKDTDRHWSSSQSRFERGDGLTEYDPETREWQYDSKLNLDDAFEACGQDSERIAQFLFSRIITCGDNEFPGGMYARKVKSSPHLACVAEVDGRACFFYRWEGGGGNTRSEYRTLEFGFPPAWFEVRVRDPGRCHTVQAFSENVIPDSHFYRFLTRAAANKKVEVWFPSVNFLNSQPLVIRQTLPVGFFTRRQIPKALKEWGGRDLVAEAEQG